jgi:hypothetical protein
LYQDLKSLGCAGGKFSSALDRLKIMSARAAVRQLRRQNIGCGHCILDCEIDSHSADGRHCMRSVTNTEKPRTRPSHQPVHLYREKAYVVPVTEFVHAAT